MINTQNNKIEKEITKLSCTKNDIIAANKIENIEEKDTIFVMYRQIRKEINGNNAINTN